MIVLLCRSNISLVLVLMVLISGAMGGCADTIHDTSSKSGSKFKNVTQRQSAGHRSSRIKSWAYQLQKINPAKIAKSPADLVVIDYSQDGTDGRAFSAAKIRHMRRKPNGKSRIILAYLSIGEAETYRFYWQTRWKKNKPAWLGPENANWPNNYKVRYWDKNWQNIIFGHREAYLDKIIAAGFDGIYLDIIDAYEFWQNEHPGAADDMVRFVQRLAKYGRSRNKNFWIIPQNGEGLLKKASFTASINAFAKEDLLFGVKGEGLANTRAEITYSRNLLNLVKQAGKPVFVVEYLSNPNEISQAKRKLKKMGFIPYFSRRSLDRLATRSSPAFALKY